MKTRYCDECKHFGGPNFKSIGVCKLGHKPKFFMPKNALDPTYGFKRKCAEYEEKP